MQYSSNFTPINELARIEKLNLSIQKRKNLYPCIKTLSAISFWNNNSCCRRNFAIENNRNGEH